MAAELVTEAKRLLQQQDYPQFLSSLLSVLPLKQKWQFSYLSLLNTLLGNQLPVKKQLLLILIAAIVDSLGKGHNDVDIIPYNCILYTYSCSNINGLNSVSHSFLLLISSSTFSYLVTSTVTLNSNDIHDMTFFLKECMYAIH